MKPFQKLALLAALPSSLLWANLALAQDFTVAKLTVNQPWARVTVAAQTVGGGYMSISNAGKTDDALLAVKWDGSRAVELHTHAMADGGVMQMRQISKIPLPAGQTVVVAPGGFHLMFMDLKKPLQAGELHDAVLVFEKAGELKVQLKVEPLSYKPAGTGAAHAH